MLGYLRARFPLSPNSATPNEIGSSLTELGLSPVEVEEVVDFFLAVDAQRFFLGGEGSDSLATEAGTLISRLEST